MRLSFIFLAGGIALLTGCQSIDSEQVKQTVTAPLVTPPVVPEAPLPAPIIITDVWERIRMNMQMPIPDEKLVNQYRDWYIRHPEHLARVSERAEPFMYLIVEELERRNIPIELALLPIVESAFDPFAYSHGAASGLWQFTSPMARHFGLQMNWWYDGRRDVPAATSAALDMLQYLHGKTDGNWLHAIAAYNTGEGRVLNAVKYNQRKGKNTDFWSLDLPRETERYVPQLLALAEVIKNADNYGITLAPIGNKPSVEIIDVGSQIDLSFAADLADMPLSSLHKLNPGYNRWSTSPDGPHRLVVPVDKAQGFKLALADTDSSERLHWLRYKIKSGDSLGLIAHKYHTTTDVIRSVNNIKGNTIVTGKHLLIPVAAKNPELYSLSSDQRLARKQGVKRANYKINYQVKSGDSLWNIARANNVKVSQLAAWNGMAPKDPLKVGQKLVIWTNKLAQNQTQSSVMRTVNYKVHSGDSLARIADKFNVTVSDLLRWNGLDSKKYLQPGQMLKLYVDVTKMNV
ncbi:MAG: LysM peptidoglycan-binding domain-containing protein [Shewanella sp.]|nr:LysM peptidoglycan-binding domain-containing protein [Shewanella sp.]MCF1429661.1 LysM peptidoglycan-binding domain-containing protein [Shewanella sp.]MCF1437415.1 LysM peptidoglycan-binding domain-containing protein [Shewanella sp.]MCF1456295.1 LysM peptidoglycan-binding domain-containing protein [Shewanella sp.]